ncbi:hypothetical protein BYT27DRAFT_7195962 [Phlegmacium glaucopus]|nr:hypothetical protein BYT27DRAFT_7195962 [Phlegmacium glaucopus]
MDQQQRLWHLTVIRLEGMRLMRPEKSWRPIVTVEIDKHNVHETILGVDGQNINQRERFSFDQATLSSVLQVNVWQRSQSKKKSKKRNLVASGCHHLGELLRKREHLQNLEFEIRLQCRSDNKSVCSRGRPQNGAILRVRLRPPSHIQNDTQYKPESDCQDVSGQSVDLDSTSVCSSDPPPTPEPGQLPSTDQTIRRRPIRGYIIDSDDDCYREEEDQHLTDSKPIFDDNDSFTCIDDDTFIDPNHNETRTVTVSHQQSSIKRWIAFSLLPRYTEKVEVPPPLGPLERILASFTMYSELKEANMDSHFERVFVRLQMEWTYTGGLLVALAAVDTAVFSISPGSLFTVDTYAKGAIAASSIASGLGIACDAWFLLRYNWADLHTFIVRARDVYGSYFFFSLSARVPALCMFISAFCLMGFLGLVAFNAWPQGVIAVCFLVGVVMSLQFLVFGAHWCATRVVEGGRASGRSVVRVVRSMTG